MHCCQEARLSCLNSKSTHTHSAVLHFVFFGLSCKLLNGGVLHHQAAQLRKQSLICLDISNLNNCFLTWVKCQASWPSQTIISELFLLIIVIGRRLAPNDVYTLILRNLHDKRDCTEVTGYWDWEIIWMVQSNHKGPNKNTGGSESERRRYDNWSRGQRGEIGRWFAAGFEDEREPLPKKADSL